MAASPFILVLDPTMQYPADTGFNRLAEFSPLPLRLGFPADIMRRKGSPFDFSPFRGNPLLRGLVVMGSAASVRHGLETPPWIARLEEFTRQVIDSGRPVLTLCFGHQMLGHMYGGRNEYVRPDREMNRGCKRIKILDSTCPLFRGFEGEFYAGVNHEDEVHTLGEELVLLAEAEYSRNQVIQVRGRSAWGFQPHLEAYERWLIDRGHLDEDEASRKRRMEDSGKILANFLSLCD